MLLPAALPITAVVLIGVIASRTLSLEPQPLSQLTVYILLPALVADSLYRTTLASQSVAGLLLGFALISTLLYSIVRGLSHILKLSPTTHKSLMATTILPNNGNLGLPLIAFALGSAGLERGIIYMIGSSILLFGLTPALLKGSDWRSGLRLTLKLPLIWAMLAGVSLHIFRVQLPLPAATALKQLGQAAIPVSLIVLGLQLANTRFTVGRYELAAAASRLLLAPLLAWGIGTFLRLEVLDLQVFILQSGMPAAVNSVVLVTEFGGDAARVARTVVATTLLSFFSLQLVVWTFNFL